MNWLMNNWRLIIDILSVIIVSIFFFIKKKPIKLIEGLDEAIIRLLPPFINRAEETDLKGEDKKQYVMLRVIESLQALGYKDCDPVYVKSVISTMLELYLSTPQKKGEIENGEK